MAKRKQSASVKVIKVPAPRAAAPIIKVAAPRAPAKTKHHRRRSHASSGGGGLNPKTMLGAGLGGAALGFIEKSFPSLPTIPLIGRAGTVALGAYFLSKRGGMGGSILRDVALAGAAIAGYQLGHNGKISGDVMGDVAPQVSGIAAQV